MEETYNLNKTKWFLNPWFDIILLAGFPIVLIIPWVCSLHSQSPSSAFYMYTLFNFPHVFSTLAVVYLSSQEYKKKPLQFLGMPLVFLIATTVLFTLGYSYLISTTRFYWGTWHIIIQYLYILQLYKLRNQDYLKFDKILDTLALVIGPLLLIFRHLYLIQIKFAVKSVFGISMDKQLLILPMILTYLIVTVFILRQAYLFIRCKKTNPFRVLLVFMVIFNYSFPLMYFSLRGLKDLAQVLITFHDLQYIVWVWFFLRQKFKEGIVKEAKVISYLSQSHRVVLYFLSLLFISIAFNFISISVVGYRYHSGVITSTFAYIHFFLDGRIWKVSKVQSIVNA